MWAEVVERLREEVKICKQQRGFIPEKYSTDTLFALRLLMKKYRKEQKELHCVLMDLKKAYDSVLTEE